MESQYILILTFGSFSSLILLCACIRYCKDRGRQMQEETNVKKLHEKLKRKNIIKPITALDEEVKDEKENNFRTTEIITNEDNV